MYKHMLIATDGSELATKALEHGLALAKHDNAPVTVVTVTEPWAPLAANRILDGAAQRGNAHGVTCDVVHVKDQHPAEGIVATAKEKGCDLIVMASHGRRGVSRLLLGSQAYEVLTHCSVPALIVR